MSVLKVKNGNQWDIVPAIKGDPGDPAADESITDDMLVTDGIKTEIEWLWGNQLMDSREGELLHAEDAYTAPAVDISVDGKSTQVTTTGKNLLPNDRFCRSYYNPAEGVVFNPESTPAGVIAKNNDGTFTMTPNAAWSGVGIYTDILPEGNYHLKIGFSGSAPRISIAYADPTTMQFVGTPWNYTANGTHDRTHPFSGERIVVISIMSASTAPVTFTTPQLESGTAATEYEPYSGGKPSPNPDYPQEIVSVDEPALEVHGINLWGGEALHNKIIELPGAISGSNEYGNYVSVGSASLSDVELFDIPFKESTQYTLLLRLAKSGGNTNVNFRINYIDGGYTWIFMPSGFVENTPYALVVTSTAGKTIKNILGVNASYGTIFYYDDCGIFEGVVTATSYEPYLGNTASLLPDGYSLRSLPNGTKDELHLSYLRPSAREGWAWYDRELVKNTVVITSEELASDSSWGHATHYSQNAFYVNCAHFPLLPRNNNIACTHFIVTTDVTSFYSKYGTVYVDGNINFNVDPAIAGETTASFVTWLASTDLELLAPLATPTTETLDPIELPIMPSRTVNVWSDPATNLKMTYIQDSNLIIENLEATIADIATS